jgi:hypothetical protein
MISSPARCHRIMALAALVAAYSSSSINFSCHHGVAAFMLVPPTTESILLSSGAITSKETTTTTTTTTTSLSCAALFNNDENYSSRSSETTSTGTKTSLHYKNDKLIQDNDDEQQQQQSLARISSTHTKKSTTKKKPPKIHPTSGGRITLVGAGPGSPDLLTMAAYRIITDPNNFLIVDRLVSNEILELIQGEYKVANKHPGCAELAQQEIYEWCKEGIRNGKHVVRLKIGEVLPQYLQSFNLLAAAIVFHSIADLTIITCDFIHFLSITNHPRRSIRVW